MSVLEQILATLQPALARPAALLRAVNPAIPNETDHSTSVLATWYLRPEQHVFEWTVFVTVYLAFLLTALLHVVKRRSEFHARPANDRPNNHRGVWFDKALGVVLVAIIVVTVGYKRVRGHELFLLQPCHVFSVVLAVCLVFVDTRGAEVLFNMHLSVQWAPWLALLTPDLRDYGLPWEIPFFFGQHWLITLIPFYLIFRRRFQIYACWPWAVAAHTFWSLYHLVVLFPASVVFGVNLNYMLVAPGGLRSFGQNYRWVMQGLCVVLVVISWVTIGATIAVRNRLCPTSTTTKRKKT